MHPANRLQEARKQATIVLDGEHESLTPDAVAALYDARRNLAEVEAVLQTGGNDD